MLVSSLNLRGRLGNLFFQCRFQAENIITNIQFLDLYRQSMEFAREYGGISVCATYIYEWHGQCCILLHCFGFLEL